MTSTYKILFSIELLHQYYSDGRCLDLVMLPSAATQKLLHDSRMLFKVLDNELWVLAKTDGDGKPLIPLKPDQKFVFYLQLVQPQLMTVTNLDADAFTEKRFYFSNLGQNQSGTTLHLTRPLPQYDPTVHYYPGMFASGGDGVVYECIKENPPGNDVSRNTSDGAFWMARGTAPFVSHADMVAFASPILRLQADAAAGYTIKAFALNKANNLTYNIELPIAKINPLSVSDTLTPGVKEVQADFSALFPARYAVQVNGQSRNVYLDDAAVTAGYFGVIEIFNHLPGDNAFSLLDAAGRVKDTVIAGRASWLRYTIRFANRLAFIKYISLNRGIRGITDSRPVAQRQFSFAANPVPPPPPQPPPNTTLFVSNKPVPLLQQLDIFNLSMPAVFGTETLKAPNPNPMLPGVLNRLGKDYYCTVVLNY